MEKEHALAVVSLFGADKWTPEGRKVIADWLRGCADALVERGEEYDPTFIASYMAVGE